MLPHLLRIIENAGMLIIDEFGNSLHNKLAEKIIEFFMENVALRSKRVLHAIIILVKNFDCMKLFLIGGMEDLNFNYCYKIIYESGEAYDRRRNELSVEVSKRRL